MKKINYPESLISSMPRMEAGPDTANLRFQNFGGTVEKVWAEVVSQLVNRFTAEDFAAARLNPNIPWMYRTPESTLERASSFERSAGAVRPTSAYTLHEYGRVTSVRPRGMASFANSTRGRFLGLKDDGIRQAISWFDGGEQAGVNEAEDFANEAMRGIVKLATASGLSELRLLVCNEDESKNPDLIVVEHIIDPSEHGFSVLGAEVVRIEDREYEGVVWSRKFGLI